jgi:hypothetical protein
MRTHIEPTVRPCQEIVGLYSEAGRIDAGFYCDHIATRTSQQLASIHNHRLRRYKDMFMRLCNRDERQFANG